MPYAILRSAYSERRIGIDVFPTEKLAIDCARKLRIDEIDRLQEEVNRLDERYDRLEDEEMKAEG